MEDVNSPEVVSNVNLVRDTLLRSFPGQQETIQRRDQVAETWCKENGKDKKNLSFEDVMAIRSLPGWNGKEREAGQDIDGI